MGEGVRKPGNNLGADLSRGRKRSFTNDTRTSVVVVLLKETVFSNLMPFIIRRVGVTICLGDDHTLYREEGPRRPLREGTTTGPHKPTSSGPTGHPGVWVGGWVGGRGPETSRLLPQTNARTQPSRSHFRECGGSRSPVQTPYPPLSVPGRMTWSVRSRGREPRGPSSQRKEGERGRKSCRKQTYKNS